MRNFFLLTAILFSACCSAQNQTKFDLLKKKVDSVSDLFEKKIITGDEAEKYTHLYFAEFAEASKNLNDTDTKQIREELVKDYNQQQNENNDYKSKYGALESEIEKERIIFGIIGLILIITIFLVRKKK